MRRLVTLFLLLLSVAAAQEARRYYIVELTGEPAAEAVIAEEDTQRRGVRDRRSLRMGRERVRREQMILRRILERHQVGVEHSLDTLVNAVVVRTSPKLAEILEGLPGVKGVHRSGEVRPAMDRAVVLQTVRDAWAWAGFERAGEGVKIAIIDSGIDVEHPAFQAPSLTMPSGYPLGNNAEDVAFTSSKVIVYRNYESLYTLQDPASPRDYSGHGTSVAMCAAGVVRTAPLATISGVAPQAYLGAYKVFPGRTESSARDDVILQAMEDAVRDGMDILNISIGSTPTRDPAADIFQAAVDRAAALGVLVVRSAGNDGPDPGTIGEASKAGESTIAVGASENDRLFGSTATVSGTDYLARAGGGPKPAAPITGQLYDVSLLDDGTGRVCEELPAGSLTGMVAFIFRGECNFSVKLNNAEAAGAVAALLYTHSGPMTTMSVGDATLPGMMISNEDGLAVKSLFDSASAASTLGWPYAKQGQALRKRFANGGTLPVTLDFQQQPYPFADNRVADFSSRGPAPHNVIKPDMVGIGANVYTAKSADHGDAQQGYRVIGGTSFSAPTVAGAAAVLMAARPNLSIRQYRSLLVNTAEILKDDAGRPLPVQHQGAGRLNLAAAVRGALTANPVSVSFGTGDGTIGQLRQILVSSTGIFPDVVSVSVVPHDPGPAPTVSHNSFYLLAGQSKYLGVQFNASGLVPGEYQGYIHLQGTRPETQMHLPYWHAVGSGTPHYLTNLSAPDSGAPGATLNWLIYLRISDEYGVAITDPLPNVVVQEGGGEVVSLGASSTYPGTVFIRVKLGPAEGNNVFAISAGSLSTTITVEGKNP